MLSAEKQPVVFAEQFGYAKTDLRNLLNLRPSENMAADPAQFRLLPVKGVNLDVPITVLANRPDLRAAEYRLQASQQSVNAQKRSWYPVDYFGCKSEYVFR